jgi:uncharacterized protein
MVVVTTVTKPLQINQDIINMNSYLPKTVSELVEQLQLIPHPEGGFFRETHRSGSTPMNSRGLTDTTTSSLTKRSLVKAANLSTSTIVSDANVDITDKLIDPKSNDLTFVVRNAITSIFWVPTVKSPTLILGLNLSDHVHYYQGGGYAFVYHIYHPKSGKLRTEILGPNMLKGQRLQVCVSSGEWKCGHLVPLETTLGDSGDDFSIPCPSELTHDITTPDYAIIGEGVGPGFDINDFHWISASDLDNAKVSMENKLILQQYLHTDMNVITNKIQDFDKHYDEIEK